MFSYIIRIPNIHDQDAMSYYLSFDLLVNNLYVKHVSLDILLLVLLIYITKKVNPTLLAPNK